MDPWKASNFLLATTSIQTSSGVHPDSYLVNTKVRFSGEKRPDCEADHLHVVLRLQMRQSLPQPPPTHTHTSVWCDD